MAVHRHAEVVAMGPNQAPPSPTLIRPSRTDQFVELFRRCPLIERRAVRHLNFSPPSEHRVQSRYLPYQERHGSPAMRQNLEAHLDQLLVPRIQAGRRRHCVPTPTSLEQPVAPRQNLPVSPIRRGIWRVKLGDKPIDEVPPSLRPTGDDTEIGPDKRNRPSPCTSLPTHGPREIFPGSENTADGDRQASTSHLAIHRGTATPPTRHFGGLRAAEGPAHEQNTESFEKVRLTLGVRPSQNVEAGRWCEVEARIVPKIRKFYLVNVHPNSAPMGPVRSS